MIDNAYDYLIIGSSPLAGLVAGLLQRQHHKRVCLVARPYSAFGLERRFDLSIAVTTRPETLVLLKRLSAETLKLVATIGKALTERADPVFVAESADSRAALGHFLNLGQMLDVAVERVADRSGKGAGTVRVRGQHLISHHRFAPALEAWLDAGEVRRLDRDDATVTLRKDGTARVSAQGRDVEAAGVLLADDAAVITHLPPDAWDRSIVSIDATSLLLQPARPAANPFSVFLDRGLVLRQEPKGPIAAIATGSRDNAEARIATAIDKSLPLRRAGEARFRALATSDGAPLLATARGSRVLHLAGFGLTGAFFAPAIARHLAGVASEDEAAWFAARGATRGNLRLNASEFPVAAMAEQSA
jgi:hypothetical protein